MTIIFQDGFESGTLYTTDTPPGKWTGNFIDAGNTVEASNAVTHTGGYAGHMKVENFTNWAVLQRALGANYATVYCRLYVYWVTFPPVGGGVVTYCIRLMGNVTTEGAYAQIYNDGGTVKWRLRYYDNGVSTSQLLNTDLPQLNTWYCVELKSVVNAGAGEARFYLNGVEKLSATSLNNAAEGLVYALEPGLGGTGPTEMYIDDVVVADEYIGPQGKTHFIYVKYG